MLKRTFSRLLLGVLVASAAIGVHGLPEIRADYEINEQDVVAHKSDSTSIQAATAGLEVSQKKMMHFSDAPDGDRLMAVRSDATDLNGVSFSLFLFSPAIQITRW